MMDVLIAEGIIEGDAKTRVRIAERIAIAHADAIQQHGKSAVRPGQIRIQIAVEATADVQGHRYVGDAAAEAGQIGSNRQTAGVAVGHGNVRGKAEVVIIGLRGHDGGPETKQHSRSGKRGRSEPRLCPRKF